MKIVIEKPLELKSNFSDYYSDEDKIKEFNYLIRTINDANSEGELRKSIARLNDLNLGFNHFILGFGSSHMWVHEKIFGETCLDRLLIVEF